VKYESLSSAAVNAENPDVFCRLACLVLQTFLLYLAFLLLEVLFSWHLAEPHLSSEKHMAVYILYLCIYIYIHLVLFNDLTSVSIHLILQWKSFSKDF
jgi:hypothetical protein